MVNEPSFDYVGLSDRPSGFWLDTFKACASVHIEVWSDKRCTEAFVTHKVSVECFEDNGRRINGQKLFKFRTPDAQRSFCAWLDGMRTEAVKYSFA